MFGAFGSSGSLGMGVVLTLVDDFSANAATAQSSMQELGLSVDAVANRIDKSLAQIKKGAMQMGVGLAILAPFALATNEAIKFEEQMSSVRAVTGATAAQMEIVRKSVMEFGPAMGYGATEAAKGVEELLKAGVDFSVVANGGLRDALILAKAGELDLAGAAELASGALNAFRRDNLSLKEIGNVLAGAANASAVSVQDLRMSLQQVSSVATNAGLTFKDTNVALAAMGQNFLKGSDAGTSFKSFLQRLQPQSSQALEYMKKFGLAQGVVEGGGNGLAKTLRITSSAFFDQTGKVKNMAAIAEVLRTNMSSLTDQQRLFYLGEMFGTDAVRFANILYKEGAVGLNAMQAAMEKVTAEQVAMERLNNVMGEWSIFKAELQKTAIVIGTMFLPVLKGVVSFMRLLNDGLQKIASNPIGAFVLKFIAATGAVITLAGAFNVVRGAISLLWATAAPALAGMWAALAPILPILLPIGAAIFLGVKAFKEFGKVLEGNAEVADGFLGFLQRIGGAIYAIGAIWNSWDGNTFDLGGMENTFEKMGILQQMKDLGTWVVRIKEFFGGFFESVASGWGAMSSMLEGTWDNVVQPIFDLLGVDIGKLGGTVEVFRNIGKVLGWVIGVPLAILGGALSLIISMVSVIGGALAGMVYGAGTLFKALGGYLFDFLGWLTTIPSKFLALGMSMGTAIYNGLVAAWDGFKDSLAMLLMAPIQPILSAIDMIAGTNLSGSEGQVQPVTSSGGSAGRVNQMINYNTTMKATPVVNSAFVDRTVTKTDSIQVNLNMDGDNIFRKMVEKGDLDNARQ